MKILIVVAGRAGSKGVKNKNLREIAGKPLIAYTIETAKKWGKADKIICSTDSEKIMEVAKKYGIEVPFMRPRELATDDVGKIPVLRHAMLKCEEIYGEKYDIVIDLDTTSPVRTTNDIDNCLKIFQEKDPDILFSVVPARKNPYFNVVELKDDGFVQVSKSPPKGIFTRQDAPKVYDMNTSIYFYKRNFLADEKCNSITSTNRAAIYVMGDISAVDIDREIDFKYIEFLITNKVVLL